MRTTSLCGVMWCAIVAYSYGFFGGLVVRLLMDG